LKILKDSIYQLEGVNQIFLKKNIQLTIEGSKNKIKTNFRKGRKDQWIKRGEK